MKKFFGTLLLCAFVAVSAAQASKTVVRPQNKAAQKQAKLAKKQNARAAKAAAKAAKAHKAKARKAV